MLPSVYLETTIPSYLTAWPSRDLVRAAHQPATREWWENHRTSFELFVSEAVLRECGAGDPTAAQLRLEAIRGFEILEQSNEALALAESLIEQIPLPERAALDALHIALSVVHGMDYLLTWNCTHIANATLRSQIELICSEFGYETPIICTPEE
jgi:predicted nucleic acid-binding protein